MKLMMKFYLLVFPQYSLNFEIYFHLFPWEIFWCYFRQPFTCISLA